MTLLLISLVSLVPIVGLIGLLLPREHVARVELLLEAPVDRVFAVIADVARAPTWRTGVSRVEVHDATHFTEVSRFGPMAFVVDEHTPPLRRVVRVADEAKGFGGTWTYVLTAVGPNTRLEVTERGFVRNPFFRFLSRFVIGHRRTLEQVSGDLQRALAREEPVLPSAAQ